MVTSATAKVLVINREDKSFLSEPLKQSIDRAILEKDFIDFDRPLESFQKMEQVVQRTRVWTKYKASENESFLKELAAART
jgi:hypothetical protein